MQQRLLLLMVHNRCVGAWNQLRRLSEVGRIAIAAEEARRTAVRRIVAHWGRNRLANAWVSWCDGSAHRAAQRRLHERRRAHTRLVMLM